jgi:hypothetical protein
MRIEFKQMYPDRYVLTCAKDLKSKDHQIRVGIECTSTVLPLNYPIFLRVNKHTAYLQIRIESNASGH